MLARVMSVTWLCTRADVLSATKHLSSTHLLAVRLPLLLINTALGRINLNVLYVVALQTLPEAITWLCLPTPPFNKDCPRHLVNLLHGEQISFNRPTEQKAT